jgi:hypothetical protein
MTVLAEPINIEVTVPGGPAYAEEWVPVLLAIRRPDSWATAVRIRNVSSLDPGVQFDLDLLDRDLEVRPGETYRLTLPLRVALPRELALDTITVQVQEAKAKDSHLIPLPPKRLEFRPAIGNEIHITLDPICPYRIGTKVQLTLHHGGTTIFEDLTVNLVPEQAIRAGKRTLQRQMFKPGEDERVDLVIDQEEIEIALACTADGKHAEARRKLAVAALPAANSRRFRFLEPRRLSTDQIAVFQKTGDELRSMGTEQGIYPLWGGCQYQIVIRPLQAGVSHIRIRDIQGRVHVRNVEEDRQEGAWRFLVEVIASSELFRKSETIYYDVESRGGDLTGEIPICLLPPRWTYWRVASALGVALTVQGVVAVGRFLLRADFDLTEAMADFNIREDFNLLFLMSIPVFWFVFKVADWLQDRLQS